MFRALARFTGLVSQRLLLDGVRGQPGGREIVQKTQQGPPSRRERTFAPTGTTIDRPHGRHGYR